MTDATDNRAASDLTPFLAMITGHLTTREYWGTVVYDTMGLSPRLWWANERIKDMINA